MSTVVDGGAVAHSCGRRLPCSLSTPLSTMTSVVACHRHSVLNGSNWQSLSRQSTEQTIVVVAAVEFATVVVVALASIVVVGGMVVVVVVVVVVSCKQRRRPSREHESAPLGIIRVGTGVGGCVVGTGGSVGTSTQLARRTASRTTRPDRRRLGSGHSHCFGLERSDQPPQPLMPQNGAEQSDVVQPSAQTHLLVSTHLPWPKHTAPSVPVGHEGTPNAEQFLIHCDWHSHTCGRTHVPCPLQFCSAAQSGMLQSLPYQPGLAESTWRCLADESPRRELPRAPASWDRYR
jgi:hypothetical protein